MDSSREAQRHREMNLSISERVAKQNTQRGTAGEGTAEMGLCCGASQARRDRNADYEERRRQELLEALGEGYNGELDFAESETASELAPTPGRESYSGEDTPSRSPSRSRTTSRASSRESPHPYDSSSYYETTESDRTESVRAAREAEAGQGSDGGFTELREWSKAGRPPSPARAAPPGAVNASPGARHSNQGGVSPGRAPFGSVRRRGQQGPTAGVGPDESLTRLAGEAASYEAIRATLNVEQALDRPLAEVLAPVDAVASFKGKRHNLFSPYQDMPKSLLLPYQNYQAYGQPKQKENR